MTDEEHELTWRPFTDADVPAVAELSAIAEAADDEGESWGAEDIGEEISGPAVDRTHGAFGAFTADGLLVAISLIFARTAADPVHQMFAWNVVHPQWRGRGVGAQLTERSLAAARAINELRFPGAPAVLQLNVYEPRTDLIEHLERRGFKARHFEFMMEQPIRPEAAAAEPQAPDGYSLLAFSEELSEEFRTTHNLTFVGDHPGSTPHTPETWTAMVTSESLRHDLSFGVRHEATGELVGYVLSRYYEADTVATGRRDAHLSYIGTRREHRGRGVASTVIAAVLHTAAKQGYDTASLGVRADNPSGALGVYERAGFTVRRRFINYARTL